MDYFARGQLVKLHHLSALNELGVGYGVIVKKSGDDWWTVSFGKKVINVKEWWLEAV